MRFEVKRTKSFKKSYKKLIKNKSFKEELFLEVVGYLSMGQILEKKFLDHKLNGFSTETRECHIQNDILLVYRYENKELILVLIDIGSHSDLF